jgi:hypothetical protein
MLSPFITSCSTSTDRVRSTAISQPVRARIRRWSPARPRCGCRDRRGSAPRPRRWPARRGRRPRSAAPAATISSGPAAPGDEQPALQHGARWPRRRHRRRAPVPPARSCPCAGNRRPSRPRSGSPPQGPPPRSAQPRPAGRRRRYRPAPRSGTVRHSKARWAAAIAQHPAMRHRGARRAVQRSSPPLAGALRASGNARSPARKAGPGLSCQASTCTLA